MSYPLECWLVVREGRRRQLKVHLSLKSPRLRAGETSIRINLSIPDVYICHRHDVPLISLPLTSDRLTASADFPQLLRRQAE